MTHLLLPPTPCLIYHFTAFENLPAILAGRQLLSHSQAQPQVDISDEGIQRRRARRQVEAGPGGVLHDYVPFYFAPKSPMMHRLHKQDIENGTTHQKRLVYLVSSTDKVAEFGLPFAFTNGHAEMRVDVSYFDQWANLTQLDWAVIRKSGWNGDEERRKRQSEFLVHSAFPLAALLGFATHSEELRRELSPLLQQHQLGHYVDKIGVRPGWYY